jgi:excisionase family DNA binding protein
MQGRQSAAGKALLSAQQVQTMLHIDRSTVYRMAEDGRLPAIKVGRQWRFPAEQIDALLNGTLDSAPGESRREAQEASGAPREGSAPRPAPEIAASVSQVAAELLGVMMVVTDMDGQPVIDVANPCPWFADRFDDPHLLDACTAEWQQLADDPHFAPRFHTGELGFQCARAFIRSGSALVGMVLAGGIAPEGNQEKGLYHLDGEQRRRVLEALPRVAAALSRVDVRVSREPQEQRTAEGRTTR